MFVSAAGVAGNDFNRWRKHCGVKRHKCSMEFVALMCSFLLVHDLRCTFYRAYREAMGPHRSQNTTPLMKCSFEMQRGTVTGIANAPFSVWSSSRPVASGAEGVGQKETQTYKAINPASEKAPF